MYWNSHDPQGNTNSTTEQASIFSTRTVPHNFAYGTSVLCNAHDTNSTTAQAIIFPLEPYNANLLTEHSFPVNPHHYQISHHLQKASRLQENICHTTTHPNRNHTYQINLIQTPVCHILFLQTLLTTNILNKDNVRLRNGGVKDVKINLLKSAPIL